MGAAHYGKPNSAIRNTNHAGLRAVRFLAVNVALVILSITFVTRSPKATANPPPSNGRNPRW